MIEVRFVLEEGKDLEEVKPFIKAVAKVAVAVEEKSETSMGLNLDQIYSNPIEAALKGSLVAKEIVEEDNKVRIKLV